VQHLFGVDREGLAGGGEADAPAGPLDQVAAGLPLELGELLADRGRTDVQARCGGRDPAAQRDGVQYPQATRVQLNREATLHRP
jgi:hypothetical protein